MWMLHLPQQDAMYTRRSGHTSRMSDAIASLRPQLESGLKQLALNLELVVPLLDYLALLARWNATYNLTAIRDPREMLTKHLLDSLTIAPFMRSTATLADLGTGPGLPGIPLAIALPSLQVTLVESNGKKARFLREAVRKLGLDNAAVCEGRIEACKPAQGFDAITARALATLPLILELGGYLLKPEGRLLAMKGADFAAEIAALPEGWRVLAVHPLHVPGLDGQRHLVEIARAGVAA